MSALDNYWRHVEAAYEQVQGLEAQRAAGRVVRFHQHGETLGQRVDSHSWGVAMLVLYLWPEAGRDLVVAALRHDVGEGYTGDVSATTKWRLGVDARAELDQMEEYGQGLAGCPMPPLNLRETMQLRLADQLELMIHCLERIRQGDHAHAPGPFWRVAKVVDQELLKHGEDPTCLPGYLVGVHQLLARMCEEAAARLPWGPGSPL